MDIKSFKVQVEVVGNPWYLYAECYRYMQALLFLRFKMNFYFIISPFLKKHSKNKNLKVMYLVLPAECSQFQVDSLSRFSFPVYSHLSLSPLFGGSLWGLHELPPSRQKFHKMWNPDSSSRYEFQTFPHKVTLGWLCPFIKDDPTPADSNPFPLFLWSLSLLWPRVVPQGCRWFLYNCTLFCDSSSF